MKERTKPSIPWPLVAAALLLPAGAGAHHSTGLFDGTKLESVEGTVTRVAWRSPHVYVFVEGSALDGGTVEWRLESLPVPIMVRQGWSEDSLAVGERVTAEIYVATGSTNYAWLHRIVKEDGTILDPGSTGSPGIREGEVAN